MAGPLPAVDTMPVLPAGAMPGVLLEAAATRAGDEVATEEE